MRVVGETSCNPAVSPGCKCHRREFTVTGPASVPLPVLPPPAKVPPLLTITKPEPVEPVALLALSIPPLIVVPPLYVLTPDSVKTPVPPRVRAMTPPVPALSAMTPAYAVFAVPLTVKVLVLLARLLMMVGVPAVVFPANEPTV